MKLLLRTVFLSGLLSLIMMIFIGGLVYLAIEGMDRWRWISFMGGNESMKAGFWHGFFWGGVALGAAFGGLARHELEAWVLKKK